MSSSPAPPARPDLAPQTEVDPSAERVEPHRPGPQLDAGADHASAGASPSPARGTSAPPGGRPPPRSWSARLFLPLVALALVGLAVRAYRWATTPEIAAAFGFFTQPKAKSRAMADEAEAFAPDHTPEECLTEAVRRYRACGPGIGCSTPSAVFLRVCLERRGVPPGRCDGAPGLGDPDTSTHPYYARICSELHLEDAPLDCRVITSMIANRCREAPP